MHLFEPVQLVSRVLVLTSRCALARREEAGCLDRLLKAKRRRDPLYYSNSLHAALMRPWFWCHFLLSAAWMVFVVWAVLSQEQARMVNSAAFRLVSIKERSGEPSTTPGVQGWGLMRDGCRQGAFSQLIGMDGADGVNADGWGQWNVSVDGAISTMRFSGKVSMNGWFFEPQEDGMHPERHPVLFAIEAEDEASGEWVHVGSHVGGLINDLEIMLPLDATVFDKRKPWEFSLFAAGLPLMYAVIFTVGVFCGITGRPSTGEVVIGVGFFAQGVLAMLCFFFALVIESRNSSRAYERAELLIVSGTHVATTALIIVAYFAQGRRIFVYLFLSGVIHLLSVHVRIQDRDMTLAMSVHALISMCPLILQTVDRELRTRPLDHLVREGVRRWREAWAVAAQGESEALTALEARVEAFVPRGAARQCNRSKAAKRKDLLHMTPFNSVVEQSMGRGTPSKVDPRSPVRSLDQLSAQAEGLQKFLVSKSRMWALESGGMFALKHGGLARWSEEMVVGLLAEQRLKRPRRCIEKCIRAYAGDVSYLLDICRTQIVFDSVADLMDCLEAILRDLEVVVVGRDSLQKR